MFISSFSRTIFTKMVTVANRDLALFHQLCLQPIFMYFCVYGVFKDENLN